MSNETDKATPRLHQNRNLDGLRDVYYLADNQAETPVFVCQNLNPHWSALIVRAVNSHDGLVYACEAAIDWIEGTGEPTGVTDELREALAGLPAPTVNERLREALTRTRQQLVDLHAAIADQDLADWFIDESINMISEGQTAIEQATAALAQADKVNP